MRTIRPYHFVRWTALATLALVALFLLAERGWGSIAERPASVQKEQGTAQPAQSSLWRDPYSLLTRRRGRQRVLGGESKTQAVLENPKAPLFPAFKTTSDDLSSEPYQPYAQHDRSLWKGRWKGSYRPCTGPRGAEVDSHPQDQIREYQVQQDCDLPPSPTFGSFRELGIDPSLCFDRWSRFNAAGFDEQHLDLTRDVDEEVTSAHEWNKVDWRSLQDDCFARNSDRYDPSTHQKPNQTILHLPTAQDFEQVDSTLHFPEEPTSKWWNTAQYLPRKGVVVQLSAGIEWPLDTVQWLRSLIMELNLHSGGEYELIILVEVKDNEIFADEGKYTNALLANAPAEFQQLVILWTPELLKRWYGSPVPSSPLQQQQTLHQRSLLLLSLARPDLDLFFSIPRSTRYTSSTYHLLKSMEAWSTAQSRKYLWERNSLFYLPAVHGSYEGFSAYVANLTSHTPKAGKKNHRHAKNDQSPADLRNGIWGPLYTQGIEPIGPDPPPFASPESEAWGLSEPADLIAAGPIFDTTVLTLPIELSGYPPPSPASSSSKSTNPNEFTKMPIRQLSTLSVVGYSKRLTRAMHHVLVTLGPYSSSSSNHNHQSTTNESTTNPPATHPSSPGIHLDAAKFAPTTALQHGLKAVSVPLPWYLDLARLHKDIDAEINGGRFGGNRDKSGNWVGGWPSNPLGTDDSGDDADHSSSSPQKRQQPGTGDARARIAKAKAKARRRAAAGAALPPFLKRDSDGGGGISDGISSSVMARRLAHLLDIEKRVTFPLDGLEGFMHVKRQAEEAEAKKQDEEKRRRRKEQAERGEQQDEEKTAKKVEDPGFGDELYKRWVGYGKDEKEKLCLPAMVLGPVGGV